MEHSQGVHIETNPRLLGSPLDAITLQPDGCTPLRRRNDPKSLLTAGPSTEAAITVFNRVLANRKSEVILMWPKPLDGIAALHSLSAIRLLNQCDCSRLATLFFPWNRSSESSQRKVLVDRDFIYRATLQPLNRILAYGSSHPSYGYVIALHSLHHVLTSGKKSVQLSAALKSDPGLEHPSLLEIMPQHGIRKDGLHKYDDQFLRRLQRYTWIRKLKGHMSAATEPRRTPFFLFGVGDDALTLDLFKASGLDPHSGGRLPDIVLVDMTSRVQGRLNGNWQEPIQRFLDLALELYLDDCPPVLAITDDVFTFHHLRNEIRDYDKWRSPDIKGPVRLVRGGIILTPQADPLDRETIATNAAPNITAEVYGSDILKIVELGLGLRKLLLQSGYSALSEAVSTAIQVIQNLVGLPGHPRQFHEFVTDRYEGFELHRIGARYDHQVPRGTIRSSLKKGLAGSSHSLLAQFADEFDELCRAADADNPGRIRFDHCIGSLMSAGLRSLVVFSSQVQRDFAEWRIETDETFAEVRSNLGQKLILVDRKEVLKEVDRVGLGAEPFQVIVFVEPRPDDFLHVLTRQRLPVKVMFMANLARTESTLRRVRSLLSIDGIAPLQDTLRTVEKEFECALDGHTIRIGELDAELLTPVLGTLDLTGTGGPGSGAVRILQTAERLRIRAFDGTELALYDPDALQVFSRGLARDLRPGDQICVFSPEFVNVVRERLHLTTDASDVLTLYHKTVAEAAEGLPGSDITAKTRVFRQRMLAIEPTLILPASIRQWIEVGGLAGVPRSAVRPQAPRYRAHYMCFMEALGISSIVAKHYWDSGIFWTRSMRIRHGASFHQVFMGILVDPYGTASRLPEADRHEVWRIYEAAQEHVMTIFSSEVDEQR
jgi:hypothetical protein